MKKTFPLVESYKSLTDLNFCGCQRRSLMALTITLAFGDKLQHFWIHVRGTDATLD